MVLIKCLNCKKEFNRPHLKSKYCSKECFLVFWKGSHPKKTPKPKPLKKKKKSKIKGYTNPFKKLKCSICKQPATATLNQKLLCKTCFNKESNLAHFKRLEIKRCGK